MDVVAPWHMESSLFRDRNCVPWIGRQIPIYSATREVPLCFLTSVFHRVDIVKVDKTGILFFASELSHLLYVLNQFSRV